MFSHPDYEHLTPNARLLYYLLMDEACKRHGSGKLSVRSMHRHTNLKAPRIKETVSHFQHIGLIEGNFFSVSKLRPTNVTNVTNERNACDDLTEITARVKKKPKDKSQSSLVWEAYADAYQARYQERPASNAKGYGICKHFIARLPIEEAPEVARFYVSHNDAFYVKQLHPLSLMLRDAEKLRTEWKVGRQMTSDTARKVEASQNNANAILEFLSTKEHAS